jgi:hypothetical protein
MSRLEARARASRVPGGRVPGMNPDGHGWAIDKSVPLRTKIRHRNTSWIINPGENPLVFEFQVLLKIVFSRKVLLPDCSF